MGVCNCSMFCCTLLYVHFSIAIILMGKRELIALLNLSSWCLVMVERLFLTVPRGCLQFVIVVFPDHTHLLFLNTLTTYTCTELHAHAIFAGQVGTALIMLIRSLRPKAHVALPRIYFWCCKTVKIYRSNTT